MKSDRDEGGESAWSSRLPSDILVRIVQASGDAKDVGLAALVCSTVCRAWRDALTRHRARWMAAMELRHVREQQRRLTGKTTMKTSHSAPSALFGAGEGGANLPQARSRLPKVVLCAARSGNPGALALAAEWLQSCGSVHLALRTWRRAARLGSAAAQVALGKLILEGDVVIDGLLEKGRRGGVAGARGREEVEIRGRGWGVAAIASARNAGVEDISTAIASMLRNSDDVDVDVDDRGGARGAENILEKMKRLKRENDMRVSGSLDAQCVEELQDSTQALVYLSKAVRNPSAERHDRAVAATLLGFMNLDGPTSSNSTAVSWFKVAAENGSGSAEETLGWMYNTGQFGD